MGQSYPEMSKTILTVLGALAKVVRKLTKKERAGLKWWTELEGLDAHRHSAGIRSSNEKS